MTSLAELRAIEEERLATERAAVIAAAAARERDRELAEQRRVADEVARLAAARDAALALERARAQAAREARLQVEAAEAAARARHVAALEQERLAHEVELRRAEVARKRPTWMLAVTAAALVAAAALGWFALDRQDASEQARAGRAQAERDRATARADAERSLVALAEVQGELDGLERRVESALADLERARTAAEQTAAEARVRGLRAQQAEVQRKRDEARQAAERARRTEKFVISEKCKRNAFDPECQVPGPRR